MARVCLDGMKLAREAGLKVGMIRPVTLWPFPEKGFEKYINNGKKFFVAELNAGQMVNDVKLVVNDNASVEFYGRLGGMIPTPVEICNKLLELYK